MHYQLVVQIPFCVFQEKVAPRFIKVCYECPEFAKIVPKKKTKSSAWIYFGLPADENGHIVADNFAVCNLCKTPISAKGGCTTNLFSHLKYRHPFKFRNLSKNLGKIRRISAEIDESNHCQLTSNDPESTASVAEISTEDVKRQKTTHAVS